MQRREFCTTALAAAISAALPGAARAGESGTRVAAMSAAGEEILLESAAVDELAAALGGQLYRQGDDGYRAAKQVWNGMFDGRQPALVAQCRSVDDIVNAVTFARERKLLLSVKGGGHSLPGKSTSDGGMMIDLSQMHSVRVDAAARTIRVGGGALLAHIDDALLRENLVTTTGIVSHTGAGGFTLGGGLGRTDRKTGLAVDNLVEATVVTAAGDVLRASGDDNADLFWALRGGGGNFGIASEFVYRAHPFNPSVYGGQLKFDISEDLLHAYAEWNESAADEANVEPQFVPGDDGTPVAIFEVCWCGDHAAGEKALSELLRFPGYRAGTLAALPYRNLQTGADGFFAHGRQYYLKSGYLAKLTPEAIRVIVEFARRGGPASWFQHLGGASARVAPGATAYAHRKVDFNFGIMYVGDDPSQNDAAIAAVREYYRAMEPHMEGFYTNLNDDVASRIHGNYGSNYPRLVELKNRYDPANLFRLNANIEPTV